MPRISQKKPFMFNPRILECVPEPFRVFYRYSQITVPMREEYRNFNIPGERDGGVLRQYGFVGTDNLFEKTLSSRYEWDITLPHQVQIVYSGNSNSALKQFWITCHGHHGG